MAIEVNILHLTRRDKKSCAEVAKVYSKNKCSICEVVKKEREMHASFRSHLEPPEVTVTVHAKCLVKIGKELHCVCIGKMVVHVWAWYYIVILGLGMHPPRKKGGDCITMSPQSNVLRELLPSHAMNEKTED